MGKANMPWRARQAVPGWYCAGMIVAIVAMSISTGQAVNLQEDVQEVSLDAGAKWAYVPNVSAQREDKKAMQAAKVLAKAKTGHWVKGEPGLTASQVAQKKALLKAKLLNGAKAARQAARKKAQLRRKVDRSKARVKKTKQRVKDVRNDIKKTSARAAEAKKEAAQDMPMKDMQSFMKVEADANSHRNTLKKGMANLKKTLKAENKARKRRKTALKKQKKVVLKKTANAELRRVKSVLSNAKTNPSLKHIRRHFQKDVKQAHKAQLREDKSSRKGSRIARKLARLKGRYKELKAQGNVKELNLKKHKSMIIVNKAREAETASKQKEVSGKNKYNAIRGAAANAPNLKRKAVKQLQNDMTRAQKSGRGAERRVKAADRAKAKARARTKSDMWQITKARSDIITATGDLNTEKKKAHQEAKSKKAVSKDKMNLHKAEKNAKRAERKRKAQIHVAREVQGKQKAAAYSVDEAYSKKRASFSSKAKENAAKKVAADKKSDEKLKKSEKNAKKDYKDKGVKEGKRRAVVKRVGKNLQIDSVKAAVKAHMPPPAKALEKANKSKAKWFKQYIRDRTNLHVKIAAEKKAKAAKKKIDRGVKTAQTSAVRTVKMARSKAENDVIKGKSAKKVKKLTTNTNESEVKSVQRAKSAVKQMNEKLKYAKSKRYKIHLHKAKKAVKHFTKLLAKQKAEKARAEREHKAKKGIAVRAEVVVKKAENMKSKYNAKKTAKERGMKHEKKRKKHAHLAALSREKKKKAKLNRKAANAALRKENEKGLKKKVDTQNKKAGGGGRSVCEGQGESCTGNEGESS